MSSKARVAKKSSAAPAPAAPAPAVPAADNWREELNREEPVLDHGAHADQRRKLLFHYLQGVRLTMLLASNELLRQEVIRLSDVLETLVASEEQENDKVQDAFANLFYMPEEIEGGGFGKLPRGIESALISAPGLMRSELLG